MTTVLLVIFVFLLAAIGAAIGSFLNVVVWRVPEKMSLTTPPSHCPKCNSPVRWFDNIPIIIATPLVFNVYGVTLGTYEITKTGFKISARHTHDSGDPVSVSAQWVAVDVSKLSILGNN